VRSQIFWTAGAFPVAGFQMLLIFQARRVPSISNGGLQRPDVVPDAWPCVCCPGERLPGGSPEWQEVPSDP